MLSSLKLTKVFSQLKVARKKNRKKKNGDQGVLFQPSYRSSWPTWSTAMQISWKKQRSHEKSWEFNLTHDRSFIIPHDVIRKPYATALNVFDHHNLAQNWNYCGALTTPDKVLERQNTGSFCLIINNNISLLRLQIVFREWRTRLFKTNRRVPTLYVRHNVYPNTGKRHFARHIQIYKRTTMVRG